MPHAVTRSDRRLFSLEDRDALLGLTYLFPVGLSYILDDAGDEVLGLVPSGEDSHGVAIVYPVPGGFCAEDERLRLLGVYPTAAELCSALTTYLSTLCAPHTIH